MSTSERFVSKLDPFTVELVKVQFPAVTMVNSSWPTHQQSLYSPAEVKGAIAEIELSAIDHLRNSPGISFGTPQVSRATKRLELSRRCPEIPSNLQVMPAMQVRSCVRLGPTIVNVPKSVRKCSPILQ